MFLKGENHKIYNKSKTQFDVTLLKIKYVGDDLFIQDSIRIQS